MLDVRYSTKFKKDFKACVKRRYNMALLQQVIDTLKIPDTLPLKNVDHNLSGNYSGYRECHVSPDWLTMRMRYFSGITVPLNRCVPLPPAVCSISAGSI